MKAAKGVRIDIVQRAPKPILQEDTGKFPEERSGLNPKPVSPPKR